MTGGKDPGIGPRVWEAYRDVQQSGDLSVRIFALWRGRNGSVEEVRGYADSLAAFTRPYEPGDKPPVAFERRCIPVGPLRPPGHDVK